MVYLSILFLFFITFTFQIKKKQQHKSCSLHPLQVIREWAQPIVRKYHSKQNNQIQTVEQYESIRSIFEIIREKITFSQTSDIQQTFDELA